MQAQTTVGSSGPHRAEGGEDERRSVPGNQERARRKARLDAVIRHERRAALFVNTRSRKGRNLYVDAKQLLTRRKSADRLT